MEKHFMHAHSSSYSSQPNANPDQMGAFQDYFPLVRSLAKKIHSCLPRTVDFDDLYSAGLAGLWQAYTRFDSSRKAKFSTYANFRVRGAILDSLRIGDWAPRALRSKGRELQAAIRTLTARLGYRPTEDEVADEMKIGLSEYQQLRSSLDGLEVGSLYRMSDDGSDEEVLTHVQTDPADDPLVRYLQTEIKTRLTDTIEDLPGARARGRNALLLRRVDATRNCPGPRDQRRTGMPNPCFGSVPSALGAPGHVAKRGQTSKSEALRVRKTGHDPMAVECGKRSGMTWLQTSRLAIGRVSAAPRCSELP
jgi:RNA polymerase sigma factor (sigma-70 family)